MQRMSVDYALDIRPNMINPRMKSVGWIGMQCPSNTSRSSLTQQHVFREHFVKSDTQRLRPVGTFDIGPAVTWPAQTRLMTMRMKNTACERHSVAERCVRMSELRGDLVAPDLQ